MDSKIILSNKKITILLEIVLPYYDEKHKFVSKLDCVSYIYYDGIPIIFIMLYIC